MTRPIGELDKREARPLYEQWFRQRDARLAWLRAHSALELPCTRDGLLEGWAWYAAWWQRTQGIDDIDNQGLPYWWIPPAPESGTQAFPDATVAIIDALAVLFGEALIAADDRFAWTMHESPKQVVGSNEPSLIRPGTAYIAVKPLGPLRNTTYRLIEGEERGQDPSTIGDVFDANLNPPSFEF